MSTSPNANTETDFYPVIIYGVVADIVVILPLILYCFLSPGSTGVYNKYHQTMINMLISSWMPFAITWLIVLIADSSMSRAALTGAMSMAGMGPFGLQWVGFASFIMAAHSAGNLVVWENVFFACLYAGLNVVMVVMHWFLSAGVFKWLKEAPLPGSGNILADEICPVCKEGSDASQAKCQEKAKACLDRAKANAAAANTAVQNSDKEF